MIHQRRKDQDRSQLLAAGTVAGHGLVERTVHLVADGDRSGRQGVLAGGLPRHVEIASERTSTLILPLPIDLIEPFLRRQAEKQVEPG